MSKKTRKKSSKAPARKSRRDIRRQATGGKGGPQREGIGQEASGQGQQGGGQEGWQGSRQEIRQNGQNRFGQSVAQARIEIVKIQSIGATEGDSCSGFRDRVR